ncbi:MAG: putative porin [Pseudomonadales bacterium]|nr:putative porin [Pseudomonadales bacterium]
MRKIVLSAIPLLVANSAIASINLDDAGKVKAYGDIRLRMEVEDKSAASGDQERERTQVRARIGLKFKPNKEWGANVRLATNSDSGVSTNQDLSTDSNDKNTEFGLDRALIQYTPEKASGLAITAGKMSMPHESNSSQFFDSDQHIDGFSAAYIYRDETRGTTKFTFTHGILNEGGFGNDDDLFHGQLSYIAPTIKDVKLNVSISATHLNIDDNKYQASEVLGISGRADYKSARLAFDLYNTDSDEDHLGLVLQGRYAINKELGVRAYYYYIEAFSMPADGRYSQNDFSTLGSFGVTNFKGIRLQVDYKLAKNTDANLRLYSMEQIKSTGAIANDLGFANWDNVTGFTDAISLDEDKVRLQANLTVKF